MMGARPSKRPPTALDAFTTALRHSSPPTVTSGLLRSAASNCEHSAMVAVEAAGAALGKMSMTFASTISSARSLPKDAMNCSSRFTPGSIRSSSSARFLSIAVMACRSFKPATSELARSRQSCHRVQRSSDTSTVSCRGASSPSSCSMENAARPPSESHWNCCFAAASNARSRCCETLCTFTGTSMPRYGSSTVRRFDGSAQ
mmetsp:Transcript_48108/g.148615  ORF Transcript_48108/g.148615 Transcript_48108/m.148615 type:complete len:202 (+) Transcript_48108:407-1012(+)